MSRYDGHSAGAHSCRGAVAGLLGGLAASFVMNEFQAAWSKAAEALKESGASQHSQGHGGSEHQQEGKPDDATQKAADAIAVAVTGAHLTKDQKNIYGPVMHYAMGAFSGAVYGAVAECSRTARAGFGTLFGTVLFAVADEIAVPALGLSQSPTGQLASAQIQPWLSHLVYGLTVETVCWSARRMF